MTITASDIIDMDEAEYEEAKRLRGECNKLLAGHSTDVVSNVLAYLVATYVMLESDGGTQADECIVLDTLMQLSRRFLHEHREALIAVLNNPQGRA